MTLKIDDLFIKNASAEVVFKELQRRTEAGLSYFSDDLEQALLSRNEKLINIALGLFSNNLEVFKQLYETDCIDTKVACLSGLSIANWHLLGALRDSAYYKQVLKELVSNGDKTLLRAFYTNSSISEDVLLDLYKKREPYKDLEQSYWLSLISATAGAKCLQDSHYYYELNKLLCSVWKLFDTLNANERNATILSSLTRDVRPVIPDDMDLPSVEKKWNIETGDEYSDTFITDAKEALDRLVQVSPNYVKRKETEEEIENKTSKLLDDFQESEASLVNQYNQEYQILKDTVVRMNQLDNDVVDLKARKELNTKWQFWQIIAFLILSSCIGMYNFINDLDSFSLGQIITTLFPLLFYIFSIFNIVSADQKILDASVLKANLLIGIDRDKLELFQVVHNLESLDWDKEPDKGVKCAEARFRLIKSLIQKHKRPYPNGHDWNVYHLTELN